MDYSQLAAELLNGMLSLHRVKPQKNIQENINKILQGKVFVLHYIASHEGDVLPGKIACEMGVSSARIATALNSLEKKGLITRQIDRIDRRKILVGITQKGKESAEKQRQTVLGIIAKTLELLGERDAREYVRIMIKLAGILPDCNEPVCNEIL